MKLKSGIWFALVVAGLLAAWFGGNELYTRYVILPRQYPLLSPGAVNLIGVKLENERIIVSNGIAKLVHGSASAFTRPEEEDASGGTAVPIKALVGALGFDSESISDLATALADIRFDMEPDESLLWKAADVRAALEGNAKLRERLEHDLCAALDGGPVGSVSWRRLQAGILLELPVSVTVPSPGGPKVVVGRVLQPYQPRLASIVKNELDKTLTGGKLEPDEASIRGHYERASQEYAKEDVADSLKSFLSETHLAGLAEPVEHLLARTTILATEKQMTEASVSKEPKPGAEGYLYAMSLGITTESRDRLWQYTHNNPGCQLLLVSNGVAIAAPFVEGEIKYSTVTITNISDEDLANDALTAIKGKAAPKSP